MGGRVTAVLGAAEPGVLTTKVAVTGLPAGRDAVVVTGELAEGLEVAVARVPVAALPRRDLSWEFSSARARAWA